jgi:hypothetical protein
VEGIEIGAGAGCFALATVMAFAAGAKAVRSREFGEALAAIEVLPTGVLRVLRFGVPVVEAIAALLLVLRPRAGALVVLVLLTSFAVLAEVMHRRGRSVSCSCFGGLSESVLGRRTVFRNGALGAVAAAVAVAPPTALEVLPVALLGTLAVAAVATVLQTLSDLARSPAETLRLIEAHEARGE